ncbi:MAG TPA: RNA-processing protein [Euryarchaeota archaeon]|nr:MAG: RNA-processing protein [Thermococci archaeon]HDI10387.1 RNA-processing protein [Euryarchaeota archaeon]
MWDYREYLRIPRERVGLVIGEGGKVKKEIERLTSTKITVSSDGEVIIEPKGELDDPLAVWKARDVIRAIARGFSPEKAMDIVKKDLVLEIINLEEFLSTRKAIMRQKARVIGREGKAKAKIEETTGTSISIHGKTVSIIGQPEEVELAREAIIKLLRGSPHGSVYKYLERRKRELKGKKLLSMWEY